MEILYCAGHSNGVMMLTWPMALIQTNMGYPFRIVHLIFGVCEILVINFTVQYKFTILHQLMHEIPSFYKMAHIEHHVTKGCYSNSSAAGLWEFWVFGGVIGWCGLAVASTPFLLFQLVYLGANIVVHTMFPHERWLQWHTLHHTVHADIYAVNVPGPYDENFSRDFSKYNEKLLKTSPFVRHAWLSDLVAFLFFILGSAVLHCIFGVGLFHAASHAEIILRN